MHKSIYAAHRNRYAVTTDISVVMTGLIVVATDASVLVANVLSQLQEWLSVHLTLVATTRFSVVTTDEPVITGLSSVVMTDRL